MLWLKLLVDCVLAYPTVSAATSYSNCCHFGSSSCTCCSLCVCCQGNMHVRHLDWEEALAAEESQQSKLTPSTHQEVAGSQPGCSNQAGPDASLAPHVAVEDKFEVIIGTDILYEVRPLSMHKLRDMYGLKSTHVNHLLPSSAVLKSVAVWLLSVRSADALQEAHSKLVAAVLNHRLTMHGQALICCAVRDQV